MTIPHMIPYAQPLYFLLLLVALAPIVFLTRTEQAITDLSGNRHCLFLIH